MSRALQIARITQSPVLIPRGFGLYSIKAIFAPPFYHYDTKKEATEEEAKFRIKVAENKVNSSNLTFNQIFTEYIEYRSKDMKVQSLNKLKNLYKIFEPIGDVKINSYNLSQHKQFLLYIESKKYSVEYNNKIVGLLKRLIKYSSKYYNTSEHILNYIENFKRVNQMKKEMEFFTYEEYLKFESVIDELDYKTFFQVLYYLGLRQGEATALTWNDIDFNKKEVSINKTLTTKLHILSNRLYHPNIMPNVIPTTDASNIPNNTL